MSWAIHKTPKRAFTWRGFRVSPNWRNECKIQDLSEGVNLGGITIHSPMVTTDTSKITALPAGTYRIVHYEEANSKLQDEVRFTIPARNQVQFEPVTAAWNASRDQVGLIFP